MLLVRAIYIEQIVLYHCLYAACLAWRGTDEDSEHPSISVRHIHVAGEVLRSGYGTALGVYASFQFGLGAEGLECTAQAADGQRGEPCLCMFGARHIEQQLYERLGADGVLRSQSAAILHDSRTHIHAAAAPEVTDQIAAVVDSAGHRVERTDVAEEGFGVEVVAIDVGLLDQFAERFGIMGIEHRACGVEGIMIRLVGRVACDGYTCLAQSVGQMASEEQTGIRQITLDAKRTEVRGHRATQVTLAAVGQSADESAVMGDLRTTHAIDEHDIFHLRFGLHHLRHRAYLTAAEDDIHGVAVVVDSEYTGCVVVTRIFAEPGGVLRIAIQHRHVGHDGSLDAGDACLANGTYPLVEKSRSAFPSERGIAAAVYIEVAAQHAVLDGRTIFECGREAEIRPEQFECRACGKELHHTGGGHHMIRTIGVDDLSRPHILHEDRHVCPSRQGVSGEHGHRQYDRCQKVHIPCFTFAAAKVLLFSDICKR